MKMTEIYKDLAELQDCIHGDSEKAVRKWSTIECDDFQIPLIVIIGYLTNASLRDKLGLRIRDRIEYKAIIEIVEHSHLSELLEVDEDYIRYRSDIPQQIRSDVERFLAGRGAGISERFG